MGTKGRSSHATTNDPANNNKGSTLPGKPPGGSHSKATIKELAEITLFHGVKHKSWEASISSPPSHMHSIGENKITKLIQKPGGASNWRAYNQSTHDSNVPGWNSGRFLQLQSHLGLEYGVSNCGVELPNVRYGTDSQRWSISTEWRMWICTETSRALTGSAAYSNEN
jgi:hypothetical protein